MGWFFWDVFGVLFFSEFLGAEPLDLHSAIDPHQSQRGLVDTAKTFVAPLVVATYHKKKRLLHPPAI